MATNKIPGKLIGVQIGNKRLQCQADATLTLTGDTTEETQCKPDDASEDNSIPWKTFEATAKSWQVTVNQALLKDSLATENADVNLAKIFIDTDLTIDNLIFRTVADQQFADNDMIYSGEALLTGFTLNAPITGSNNTSATFQGNGPLAYSYPPKTT